MTSNHKLDRTEIRQIFSDRQQNVIQLEARLQAIVDKLVAIKPELEDGHTCQCTLHLGQSRGQDVVKVDLQKRY